MTDRAYSDAEIANLLDEGSTSLQDLYRQLSDGMPGNEGFGSDAVDKAKAAVKSMMGMMRRELCPRLAQPKYRAWIDGGNSGDAINLVGVIASLVAELGVALNATLLAVILVRMGLRTVCPLLDDDGQ